MAEKTSNYGLILPEISENYNVNITNTNITDLDKLLKSISDTIVELNKNIDTKVSTAVNRLFPEETRDEISDLLEILSNNTESGDKTTYEKLIEEVDNLLQWQTDYVNKHDIVHNSINNSLSDISDSVTTEATVRSDRDNEIVKMIGILSNLKTTDKSDTVNALNEVVSNIGSLSTLKTGVKDKIVNAINNNFDYIDLVKNSVSDLEKSFNFLNNRIKNVLLMDKPNVDLNNHVTYSGNYKFNINGIKFMYYGRCIELNNKSITFNTNSISSGTKTVYISMQPFVTMGGYINPDGTMAEIPKDPDNYGMTDDLGLNTRNTILTDDSLNILYPQELFTINYTLDSNGDIISDSITYTWADNEVLPYIYNPKYMDHITGMYTMIRDLIVNNDLNNAIDNLYSIVTENMAVTTDAIIDDVDGINDAIKTVTFPRTNNADPVYLISEICIDDTTSSSGTVSLSLESHSEISGNTIIGSINAVIAFSFDSYKEISDLKVVSYTDSLKDILKGYTNSENAKMVITKKDDKYYLGVILPKNGLTTTDSSTGETINSTVNYVSMSYNVNGISVKKILDTTASTDSEFINEIYITDDNSTEWSNETFVQNAIAIHKSYTASKISYYKNPSPYLSVSYGFNMSGDEDLTVGSYFTITFTEDIDRSTVTTNDYSGWVNSSFHDLYHLKYNRNYYMVQGNQYMFDSEEKIIKAGSTYLCYVHSVHARDSHGYYVSLVLRLDNGTSYSA